MQNFLTRSAAFKGKDLQKALRVAFHDCETEFIQIAGREGLRDGTTAVVALVQDDTLTVAHVGDSRGVLCRANGTAHGLGEDGGGVRDHAMDDEQREDEQEEEGVGRDDALVGALLEFVCRGRAPDAPIYSGSSSFFSSSISSGLLGFSGSSLVGASIGKPPLSNHLPSAVTVHLL